MWVDLKAGSLSILTLMFIKSPTLNVSANIDLAKVPQNEKNLSTITTDCLKFTNKAVVCTGGSCFFLKQLTRYVSNEDVDCGL